MAITINAGKVGRSDVFFINPTEIIAPTEINGRRFPHDDVDIEKLVDSFKEEGQLQPVTVRRVDDNRVQLVLGFRRYAASLRYNERYPDAPMKLKCIVSDMDDEEAFRKNIVENKERKITSAIDDAFNQQRLRQDYKWEEKRIAEFYGCSPAYVCGLKKLLTLVEDAQRLVHSGDLPIQSAIALAGLDPKEQQAIVDKAVKGGDTSTKALSGMIRESRQANGKASTRSAAELKKFFVKRVEIEEKETAKTLATHLRDFVEGKTGEEEFWQEILPLLK